MAAGWSPIKKRTISLLKGALILGESRIQTSETLDGDIFNVFLYIVHVSAIAAEIRSLWIRSTPSGLHKVNFMGEELI